VVQVVRLILELVVLGYLTALVVHLFFMQVVAVVGHTVVQRLLLLGEMAVAVHLHQIMVVQEQQAALILVVVEVVLAVLVVLVVLVEQV
jgi:hypothetical protein